VKKIIHTAILYINLIGSGRSRGIVKMEIPQVRKNANKVDLLNFLSVSILLKVLFLI